MLVMWIMLKYEPYKRFIAGFASAVFASFLSSFLVPTVGFSGVLFGMLGYAVGSNPTFKGLLWCLPSLALFFFIPDTNALLHLLSWSFAFGIGLIVRLHNQIAYDLKDTTTE